MRIISGLLLFVLLIACVSGVDRKIFRTCSQTGFCDRHISNKDLVMLENYALMESSIDAHSVVTAHLHSQLHPKQDSLFLTLQVLESGTVRMSVKEARERYEVVDVLMPEALAPQQVNWVDSPDSLVGTYGEDGFAVVVQKSPFQVKVTKNGEDFLLVNGQQKLDFEQTRSRQEDIPDDNIPESELMFRRDIEGMWTEQEGKRRVDIQNGPNSVAMDVTFIGSQHLYGLPEHASTFALKNTDGTKNGYSEPYRLYNLDVFEFELDEPMSLYGNVPVIVSHSKQGTSGILWLNAAETFVDISDYNEQSKSSFWVSETGIIDLFLFPGPTSRDVFNQYTRLTGRPSMPQYFSIGYHQCRWNYKDEKDVANVDDGFDRYDIPYDVIWLDIEHTDGKKYFTWDKSLFPTPETMQDNVAKKGRKMVTIVDPHIKRDKHYHVHTEAENKHYVQLDGKDYEGWCWPGSVSYLDFMKPSVREYWSDLFSFEKYIGSTPNLYTWNDMNEPSVFNGPEVTMPKSCKHNDNAVEHRDVHNQYGFWVHMATHEAQIKRSNERSFVLSRSFFSGSQRFGAIWTGDNTATWEHLESTVPMLLSLNAGGMVNSGADVGGFFGSPTPALTTRWYQAAAFQPFFRGHAHIDSKRREPWLFDEPYTSIIRDAIKIRYTLLPYIYSTFYEAAVSGNAIMRAMWMEFPQEEDLFAVEDQFLCGASILVKPVVKDGQSSTQVLLPHDDNTDVWYHMDNYAPETSSEITVSTPLEKIVSFYRGGSIIPMKWRSRRSSSLMINDPYTLVVALNSAFEAHGFIYIDDGRSFDFVEGNQQTRFFSFENNQLSSTQTGSGNGYDDGNVIERVVILGLKNEIESVTIDSITDVSFVQTFSPDVLTIKKPDVAISNDFIIKLE